MASLLSMDDLPEEFTPKGRDLLLGGWRAYTGGRYNVMNGALRGSQAATPGAARMNGALDAAFESELAQTIPAGGATVYRGLRRYGDFDPGSVKVGDYLSEPGWMSVTSDLHKAEAFGEGGSGWVFHVQLPEGTRYVPGTDYESEAILRHGSVMRVLSRNAEKRTVVVEVVP